MTVFSSWIMTVVGSICLTLLIDFLMQDGETKKYVKGITSLIVFTAIIAPLPTIFNENTADFTFYQQESNIDTDVNENFLYSIKEKDLLVKAQACEKHLYSQGYSGVKILPKLSYGSEAEITNITVDIKNLSINIEKENIDINKELQMEVSNFFKVDLNLVSII